MQKNTSKDKTHLKRYLHCTFQMHILLDILCFAPIVFALLALMHLEKPGVTQAALLSKAGQGQAVPLKYLKETWLSSLESFQIQSHLINLDRVPWYLQKVKCYAVIKPGQDPRICHHFCPCSKAESWTFLALSVAQRC